MVSADLFELFNDPGLLLKDESLFDLYAIIINKEGPQPTVTISLGVAEDSIQIDTSRHLIDYNGNVIISRPLFLVDKIAKLVFIADLQTNPQEWDQPNEDIEEFVDKSQALIGRVQTQVESLIQSGQANLLIQSFVGTKKTRKKPKKPKPRSVRKPPSVAKKQKASSKKLVKKTKASPKKRSVGKPKKQC